MAVIADYISLSRTPGGEWEVYDSAKSREPLACQVGRVIAPLHCGAACVHHGALVDVMQRDARDRDDARPEEANGRNVGSLHAQKRLGPASAEVISHHTHLRCAGRAVFESMDLVNSDAGQRIRVIGQPKASGR